MKVYVNKYRISEWAEFQVWKFFPPKGWKYFQKLARGRQVFPSHGLILRVFFSSREEAFFFFCCHLTNFFQKKKQKNIGAKFIHLYIPSLCMEFFVMRHNLGHSNPCLHFYCSEVSIFLTTYPTLNANALCESSPQIKFFIKCLSDNSIGVHKKALNLTFDFFESWLPFHFIRHQSFIPWMGI